MWTLVLCISTYGYTIDDSTDSLSSSPCQSVYHTVYLLYTLYFFILPKPHMQLCRFLKAAIDNQGGLDAGGVAAVLSPALQALLNQSDTRSLTDQMSEVSKTVK
jgi:hypothetical protein